MPLMADILCQSQLSNHHNHHHYQCSYNHHSAARECVPQFRDPFSITGHYVNKSLEHVDADVIVKVLNQAKSSTTVEISLIQEDKLRAKYLW